MTWFAKIDGDCDGFVEWDECFNFLIAKVCGRRRGAWVHPGRLILGE